MAVALDVPAPTARPNRPGPLRCGKNEAPLIYFMSVLVVGFIADRQGGFAWTDPSDEQFLSLSGRSHVIYERYGRARGESD